MWCTDDELDVRWFLCDAPGLATGLRSNLAAQVEAIRLGRTRVDFVRVDPEEAMLARLDASRRASRVRRRLVAIGAQHREVLSAHFGGETPPKAVRERWGLRAAVVLLLEPLAARRTKGARAVELDELAERRLLEAQAAYAQARAGERV